MVLLKTARKVGILGYGAYIPKYRIKASEIARVWGKTTTPILEKSVPGLDEDVTTIAVEAAKNAILRARISNLSIIRTVWVGTESKPYAVKPTGTIVAKALGIGPYISAADFEFACKAGTEAVQTAIGFVGSGMADAALAIGADTAQGMPGDALEFTAAAGGAAYILAPKSSDTVAYIEASLSYVTDTPDFWRRQHEHYPQHAGRFTGDPAYFAHITGSVTKLFNETGYSASDFKYAVFHQPNVKFPSRIAKKLGFSTEQIKPGLLSGMIGNCYAGAVPLGLSATLDVANPGDKILVASFGSGAGSDAFVINVQDKILDVKELAPKTQYYIDRKEYIDYAMYAKFRNKILR